MASKYNISLAIKGILLSIYKQTTQNHLHINQLLFNAIRIADFAITNFQIRNFCDFERI